MKEGLQKLTEDFILDFKSEKLKESVEFLSKPKLVETADHKQYEARAVIKNTPVSRYIKNHNGRVYNKALWENVLKSGVAEGSDCYGNHSEDDDGNVFDTVGVWHNLRIGEEFPIADLYCIGEGGQLLAEKAKAGGRVGFSSVGYGEFMEDKMTVNPDTYELEHLADWVVSPSQEVYATYENTVEEGCRKEEKEEKIEENNEKTTEKLIEIKKNDEPSETINTNKIEENVDNSNTEENNKEGNMEKFQESNLKNIVNEKIRQAKKNPDISEAIEILEEVDTGGIEALNEKIRITITELQNKLDEKRLNAEKELKEKEDKITEMETKAKENESALKELQDKYEKVSSILEKMIKEQNVEDKNVDFKVADENNVGKESYNNVENKDFNFDATDSNPQGMDINSTPPNEVIQQKGQSGQTIGAQASSIIENTKKLKEAKDKLEEQIKELEEDRKNMKADIKALLEDRKVMISDIKQLIEDRKAMFSDIKILVSKYKEMKKKVMGAKKYKENDASAEMTEQEDEEMQPYEFSYTDEKPSEEPVEEADNMMTNEDVFEDEEMNEPEEDVITPDVEDQIAEAENEVEGVPEDVFDDVLVDTDENETLEEPMQEQEEDENEENEDEEEFEFNEEDLNLNETDLDDEYNESVKKDKKKVIKENKENPIKKQIIEYFEIETKFNPALKDMKERVLDSKSFKEAVIKINKFKENISKKDKKEDSPIKIFESQKNIPGWRRGRL